MYACEYCFISSNERFVCCDRLMKPLNTLVQSEELDELEELIDRSIEIKRKARHAIDLASRRIDELINLRNKLALELIHEWRMKMTAELAWPKKEK